MSLATFGNFFGPDTLIIFLVILVFFGAKRLPELARGMGQAIREFQRSKNEDLPPAPPAPPAKLS